MIDINDFPSETITFQQFIPQEKQRSYLRINFTVPENVCRIDIEYCYKEPYNIIDFALMNGEGEYIGSSGSDKRHIYISEWESTQGFSRDKILEGDWTIIAGAYQIEEQGVYVSYTVTYTYKQRCLLKGDLHVHTTASDGMLKARDVAIAAKNYGLDFIFITDHNNYSQNLCLPQENGIIILPGIEWTHYEGHAGMLGVQRPIDNAFNIDSKNGVWDMFSKARQNGAMVILNHPFCPTCGWYFGLEQNGYDGIELVNGDLEYSTNQKCISWWHKMLCKGNKIPAFGGSDFHWSDGQHYIGIPMTCLYALSPALSDIMDAMRRGNGYIVMQMNAPKLWVETDGKILGEEAPAGKSTVIRFDDLINGDVLRLITDQDTEEIIYYDKKEFYIELQRSYKNVKFVRFEVLRNGREILISNPIYFVF